MISALLGCTPTEQETATPVDLVAELTAPGPYGVGYRAGEVTYADPVSGEDRTLRLAIWYPAEAESAGELAAAGLYQSEVAVVDAPQVAGSFPLAVFSHGHQGYAENSSFLMEHLASHGWVVAAPDHTGNTTFDDAARNTSIYLQRPLDISAVIDAMAGAEGVGSEPVFLMGHSFGAYTTHPLAGATYDVDAIVSACADGTGGNLCTDLDPSDLKLLEAGFADPRIGASVPMAGGDFELLGEGVREEGVPVLLMTASLDQGAGSVAEDYWALLQGAGNTWVTLVDGGHQSFTDYSDVLEDVPLDQAESFRIVDAYVLAWARRMLGDEAVEPLFEGTEAVSDAALVVR